MREEFLVTRSERRALRARSLLPAVVAALVVLAGVSSLALSGRRSLACEGMPGMRCGSGGGGREAAPAQAAGAKPVAAEIVADGDVLRVLVNGKEMARFTADGLHVEGDLSYSGNISDVGYESQGRAP